MRNQCAKSKTWKNKFLISSTIFTVNSYEKLNMINIIKRLSNRKSQTTNMSIGLTTLLYP